MTGRILVAFVCAATALCATASAPARTFEGASARAEYTVGYTTARALHAASRNRIDAGAPALRIARVRLTADDAARVSKRPGIRFVQRVRERTSQTEPGLQAVLGKSSAWEWQFAAAHEDTVPDAVLRAASAVTIAVIDTPAPTSRHPTLRLRARSPSVSAVRTATSATASATGRSSRRSRPAR